MSDLYNLRFSSFSCFSWRYALMCFRMRLMWLSRDSEAGRALVLWLSLIDKGKSTLWTSEARCFRLLL